MGSFWWCNLLRGTVIREINGAVKSQLDRLEHVIFSNFTHEPAIKLCEELVKVIPAGPDPVQLFPITVRLPSSVP